MWIALALQAAQPAGAPDASPAAFGRADLQLNLTAPPRCDPSDDPDTIIVCGGADQRNDQRLEEPDPRFERPRSPDGRFVRRLSEASTLEGGGPRGSVGITLRTKF